MPPAPPAFVAADYQTALANLLPRGRAWRRDASSMMMALLGALAPTYERSTDAANGLISEAFPATTVNLLPEWEASLGLPDVCTGEPTTLQQRQAAVLNKWQSRGGQTTAYYVSVAAALGYTITITEFAAFRAGVSRSGSACGMAFVNAWQVNAPTFTVGDFRAGASTAGEPIRWWGNTALQCALRRLAPAHTVLMFSYS